jgi:hypothetical protein
MSSAHAAGVLAAAIAVCAAASLAHAEDTAVPVVPGAWDVEPFKTGLVAVSRASDRRTALLIFCTLYGTRHVVYAFDGRGMPSEDIPISAVRVLATPTIDAMGLSIASSAAVFDNDGYIVRVQIPLPADFEPPRSGAMTVGSGPEATPRNRWSVAISDAGLDESVRIAFKNCV